MVSSSEEVEQVTSAGEERIRDRDEPERLAQLVFIKFLHLESNETEQRYAAEFVRYRFRLPFEQSRRSAPRYRQWFTLLSIVTAIGGLSTTITTLGGQVGTENPGYTLIQIVVAILGALVVVVAALNQTWRPGERASAAGQAFNAYRREGWDFVNGRGRYEKCVESRKAWELFVDEISRVGRTVEAINESPASRKSEGSWSRHCLPVSHVIGRWGGLDGLIRLFRI